MRNNSNNECDRADRRGGPVNDAHDDHGEGDRDGDGGASAEPITEWLQRAFQGDEAATERLLNYVYPHLHAIAVAQLRAQPAMLTQAATDVLHEAYERLAQQRVEWRNRSHFYALAARLTRRVIVDHIRRRRAEKRGSGVAHDTLSTIAAPAPPGLAVDWLDLDQALRTLGEHDRDSLHLIEMRFFAGMSIAEVAVANGCAPATVKRHWQYAKAQLVALLEPSQ